MGNLIGIDVGGTFTDFVLVRPDGSVAVSKATTTPNDESAGVMSGLTAIADMEGATLADLLAETELIVHGTTTADNTLIEMNGAPTGLITSEGHRDEIEFRRGWKEDIWDPRAEAPPSIARRRFRIGVPGRLDYLGNVLHPLDEDAVRGALRRFKKHGISSIAVVLLFSFVDPSWERRIAEIAAEEYPEALVSLSHEVMPAAPEFERTSTTLVNAYVGPRVAEYLSELQGALRQAGYSNQLVIMQSNGGVATADAAKARPISTLASGPVGGVIGAAKIGEHAGIRDFISVDMGGTSYDICLVKRGTPEIKSHWNWVHRFCIALPIVDVLMIGAGGGSIAEVKAGGLNVGPESAGADPGPICYGRGGTKVTVTDANLYLGYLNPDAICGGTFSLDRSGVEEALAREVADPLGLTPLEAAAGIFRLTNANMNNAIRKVSSEKGHDPRKFDLIVFGGNGAVHAPAQALDLQFQRVVVPRPAPVLSAFGLLYADVVVNMVRAYVSQASEADPDRMDALLDEMRAAADKELANANIAGSDTTYSYSAECRYPGQTFTINVPFELDGSHVTQATVDRIVESFHHLHEELHTFKTPDEPVVLAELAVRAIGETPSPDLPHIAAQRGPAEPLGIRDAYFDGEMRATMVFDGPNLGAGAHVAGPGIIEETFTTIVLQSGQAARLDEHGNWVITGN
ncbi:MAG: hydantoinase/oxoprolinase family protein [Actinobacteria bacterium ATB1]|nr:hydantoinase/oxoprolinase family protein [Actinobacteria bacterium ATB1]